MPVGLLLAIAFSTSLSLKISKIPQVRHILFINLLVGVEFSVPYSHFVIAAKVDDQFFKHVEYSKPHTLKFFETHTFLSPPMIFFA